MDSGNDQAFVNELQLNKLFDEIAKGLDSATPECVHIRYRSGSFDVWNDNATYDVTYGAELIAAQGGAQSENLVTAVIGLLSSVEDACLLGTVGNDWPRKGARQHVWWSDHNLNFEYRVAGDIALKMSFEVL
jgi:hypothetical protein